MKDALNDEISWDIINSIIFYWLLCECVCANRCIGWI